MMTSPSSALRIVLHLDAAHRASASRCHHDESGRAKLCARILAAESQPKEYRGQSRETAATVTPMLEIPQRQVRAVFDDATIVVYQAYPPAIAAAAVASQTFVPPFKRERMTWVKPSFLWMMYRSGWATKPGQERVVAVRITRAGFEEALAVSCLSHFDRSVYDDAAAWSARKHQSEVRVQWDPERTWSGSPLPHRSLQVGLSGSAVSAYVDEWIVGIDDMTEQVHHLRSLLRSDADAGAAQLPPESPYRLPDDVARVAGATPTPVTA